MFLAQGCLEEAEPLFRRALAIREAALGPDHLYTAYSLNDLAELLWARGRSGEAEPLHRRALAIREAALGPDHPKRPKASTTWRCCFTPRAGPGRRSRCTAGR